MTHGAPPRRGQFRDPAGGRPATRRSSPPGVQPSPAPSSPDLRSLRQLQSLGVVVQALGLLVLLVAWMTAAPTYRYDTALLAGLCSLVAAGLVVVWRNRRPERVFPLTVFTVGLLAEALCRIAGASPAGPAWCVAIGIIFSLVMAPIFANVAQYTAALAMVWLLLSRGEWIRLTPHHDAAWNLLVVAVAVVMGLFLNWSFLGLRQAGHRQRLALEAMAYQDALTGLDNRRSLMECLRSHHDGGRLAQACFLMVDIDDFKQINDRFGHDHGDTVLQALATALRAQAAPHRVQRLGGEEFGVLMVPASREDALALAERLVRAVHALSRHPAGMPFERHGRLTISVGMAGGRPDDGPGDLLRRADGALYAAKRAGKDCFRADAQPQPTGPDDLDAAPMA